ncbi:adenosylcobinamide-GDP ribazoletransferase [Hasllibacter sp. MH4015]|uniref:adenosylcobinamide-GDP ribazoletransferase n=1 Tax=Hasllibacter sp. MH4015 TaxID=2854029 RepID=UPI001CD42519|nr:adenosylcobinamide-GDP ribazoletransferase [Hasllibacter sp. MH4015]
MAVIEPRDLIRAAQLLTRLPLPGGDGARAATASWAWPIVGAVVAALQIAIGVAALAVLPAPVAAGLALAAGLIVTGALHEDGLADCADGFWGGHTKERRLEILKDSRVGSYGVLAMIVALGLRWALLTALLPVAPLALVTAAMLSRAGMAALMGWMEFARASGLAAHVGRPPLLSVSVGIGLALVAAALAVGLAAALVAALVVACTCAGVAAIARAKIGGQTGDVLGAAQVLGEIAAHATCAALVL